MLTNNLKKPLLKLLAYAKENMLAINRVQMIFNLDEQTSKVNASFDECTHRTELSDSFDEALSFALGRYFTAYSQAFKDLPLKRIVVELDVDELGVINKDAKVLCRIKPAKNQSTTELSKRLAKSLYKAEAEQNIPIAATGLVLHLQRHHLRTIDLKFNNSLPAKSVKKQKLSLYFQKELAAVIVQYQLSSDRAQPRMVLHYTLLKRNHLELVNGEIMPTKSLAYQSNGFNLYDVQSVIEQYDQAFKLGFKCQIEKIKLQEHRERTFTVKFEIAFLDSAQALNEEIPFNFEKSEVVKQSFDRILHEQKQFLCQKWAKSFDLLINHSKASLFDLESCSLVKTFRVQEAEQIEKKLKYYLTHFEKRMQFKSIDFQQCRHESNQITLTFKPGTLTQVGMPDLKLLAIPDKRKYGFYTTRQLESQFKKEECFVE